MKSNGSASRCLFFCFGTPAELIKLYPIILRAEEGGFPWAAFSTGQGPVSCADQWHDFGFAADRLHTLVSTDADLRTPKEAAAWFSRALLLSASHLRQKVKALTGRTPDPAQDIWLVHGDTLSTLVGTIYGRRLGLRVAHVEAGLRSGDWTNPFPEEVTRILVSKLARFHFPPGPAAKQSLQREGARGRIVETEANTQVDAIKLVLERFDGPDVPDVKYGLVNIHRFETLQSRVRWQKVKETLLKASKTHRLFIVLHAVADEKLRHEVEFKAELEKNGAVWLPRQPFIKFAHWVAKSQFVICDSAGNQQECAYLGVPCLILREVTETPLIHGRKCTVLSRFDARVIDSFLASPDSYRQERYPLSELPAKTIFEALTEV